MELDPFENLPEEIILYNCNLMTNEELDNFVRLNKNNLRICQEVLNKRKEIRKSESNIPLSSNVIKHSDPLEKGVNHIEIINNDLNVEVIYNTDSLYIEFQDKSNTFIISIDMESDKIPQFIQFLENLHQGENKFEYLTIFIYSYSVQIYQDDFSFKAKCSYDNFLLILSDMINYIKRRYYNLRLGINST